MSSPHEGRAVIPISQMRKWRHRKVDYLTQGHTGRRGGLGTYIWPKNHTTVLVNPAPERKTLAYFVF